MRENLVEFDTFTNAFDSLKTATTVLEWGHNRKWKWFAISIHHALYMFCTNALHFGNYELLLKRGSHADRGIFIQIGNNDRLLKSSIEYVRENQPAYQIIWEETDEDPPRRRRREDNRRKDWLINVWSAIARVNDGIFWMNRMMYTEPVEITDEEWDALIFLTNKIRNKLAHFVPRTYILHVDDFRMNGLHVLNVLRKVIIDSRAVDYPVDNTDEWMERTEQLIDELAGKLED